jgi:hypothetical protein
MTLYEHTTTLHLLHSKKQVMRVVFLVITKNSTMPLLKLQIGLLEVSLDNFLRRCFYFVRLAMSLSSLRRFGDCWQMTFNTMCIRR